ncbi:glycoside hydrolase family 43 protein [Novosphingobium sp. 9]|uniref:glycoside hydrolase family 43 protein n=1 Tax=Novosphingobium sp. 9 TaxID=2025349 RepID=UPI0021B574D6|nr:glycoside hydrolase family 43 protein [Novosphingobium sp. 9]
MIRLDRRTACAGLGLGIGLSLTGTHAFAAQSSRSGPIVFAYFSTGKGEADGMKLAISEDGYTFRSLLEGRPVLVPQVGEKKLLRDPFLFRGTETEPLWHCVWTTAWDGQTIGHAVSRDLVTWTDQQALPVMAGIEGTRNCWAPEAIYDAANRRWVLFWSSTVEGRFLETAGTSEGGYNHRLWSTTTRDFQTFTPAQVLYDPGFSVIDGTFAHAPDGSLWLVVKDETVKPPRKWLRAALAKGPLGPFGKLGEPFTDSWVEGPMTLRVGDELLCWYDVYRDGRWGAAVTRDMVHWRDASPLLQMPPGARHGSVVRVNAAEGARLLALT